MGNTQDRRDGIGIFLTGFFLNFSRRIPNEKLLVRYRDVTSSVGINQFFEVIVYPLFIFRHHIVILLIVKLCYKCKRTCGEMQSTEHVESLSFSAAPFSLET
jgi:hypothetical protein